MTKLYTLISLIFVSAFLCSNIYAQDDLRWSRIYPDEENITAPDNYIPNFKLDTKPHSQVIGNRTYTIYPNIIMHPTYGQGSQSEMSIAVSPVNPNIVLAGSNGANTAVTYLNQGWYVTTDAGLTWYGNDSLPDKPSGYYRSDPVTGFDLNGNMFFNTIEYSSSAGDIVTLRSSNNGLTWIKSAIPNAGPDEDKNWMAIDQNPASPYVNYIYSAYTEFGQSSPNPLEFSRSTDGGVTFSPVINMSGPGGYLHQGVNLAVNKNNDVVAAYTYYPTSTLTSSNIAFTKSTNGGVSFTTPVFVASAIRDIRGNLTKGGNTIRVNSFPQIATDNSNGPLSGRIYVTWAARPNVGQAPDVYLSWSDDYGTTWSPAKRVNADSALTNRDQYFPSVEIDPADGSVNIIYYDSRNYASNDSCQVYLSRSIDGGLTFDDILISDHAFLPKSISGLASGYSGDYIEVAARNGTVWPVWNDNRTGQHQGYTAKVFFIQIDHNQLPNTENLAGPYEIKAKITASLPISFAKIYWRRGTTGAFDSLAMSQVAATDTFVASIPGNGSPSVYQYYIYAQDNVGSYATLPGGAPSAVFSFEAATDAVPPVITHTVIPDQYRETWPVDLSAVVTDNIGVDSVWVTYKLNATGTLNTFGLVLDNGVYSGTFGLDTSVIALGDSIMYRIVARDASAAHNLGYHPSIAEFNTFKFVPDTEFPVISHTALRDQPIIRWPAQVKAVVTDNLGVLSVSVEVKVNNGTPSNFNLVNTTGNTWQANFPFDTTAVSVGDTISYKIIAVDNSTSHNISYNPASGYNNFKIIATKGIVLVVNDDLTLAERISPEKGSSEADMLSPLGAGATLINTVLTASGFVVDSTSFAALDVSSLGNYDIVVLSGGLKTSAIFDDQTKRTAIVNYNLSGGKVFVEGGEVGYHYRKSGTTTDKDPVFRRTILRDSAWVSDISSGTIRKRIPHHLIYNFPNAIPDAIPLTGTTYGIRDAMRIMLDVPGIYKLSGWYSTYPDTAGIIAYSPTNDTNYVTNIFCTFAIGSITNQTVAANLVENLFEYLAFGYSSIPVEFASFSANTSNGAVTLSWQTATETNNSGFEIERRSDGTSFTKIGYVPGKGTTTNISAYSFIDDNVASGSYSYRLKQIDFNGTISYSKEVYVDVTAPAVFELSQNYPNPFNPSTSIKFSVPVDGMVNLAVYNLLGEKVVTLINKEMKAGRHEVNFEASKLASGLYFYRLEAGDFSSVKKMMLLK